MDPRLGLSADAFKAVTLKDREEEVARRWIFKNGLQVQGPFKIPKGAASLALLTSDAYGVGTWQLAAALSTGALADFWYKPGIAGSFTAYMRTTAGGSGIISSTAHATKGFINFGSLAALDEANTLLGIGTQAPTARTHWVAAATGSALTTNSTIAYNWAPGGSNVYTGSGTPTPGTSHGALSSDDGTTSFIAILGDGTNGTNPQKNGLNGTVNPNTSYTVSLTIFCLGGTMTAGSNHSVSLITSAGLKYDSATLDLVGIGTTPTIVNFTVNTGGTSSGSGTANSLEMSASCVPTGFYTCVTYVSVSSGGGDIWRWDNSSGTQLGRLSNAGYLGVGTGTETLSAMGKFKIASASQVGMIVQSAASQTGDPQQWMDSAGVVQARVGVSGSTYGFLAKQLTASALPGSTSTETVILDSTSITMSLAGSAVHTFTSGTTAFNVYQATFSSSNVAKIPLIVRRTSTFASALDLQEWRNDTGTLLSSVSSTGALKMGDSSGTSYWVAVPGDDLIVQDDAGLNLLTVRDRIAGTSPTGDDFWLDDVGGYQMQVGATSGGLRNIVIGGSGAAGSVFDRLGVQALTTVFWDSTIATMPAPGATQLGLIEARVNSTTRVPIRIIPVTSSTVPSFAIRNTADSASLFSVALGGATTIAPNAGGCLTLTGGANATQLTITGNATQTGSNFLLKAQTSAAAARMTLTNGGALAITGSETITNTGKGTIFNVQNISVGVLNGEENNVLNTDIFFTGIIDSVVRGLRVSMDCEGDATATANAYTALSFDIVAAAQAPAEMDAVKGTINWQCSTAAPGGSHYSCFNPNFSSTVGSGKVVEYSGLRAACAVSVNTGIINGTDLEAPNVTAGTLDLFRGVHIDDLSAVSGVTTAWAIAADGGNSYHAGKFSLGASTVPTAKAHLGAGTTAANTAPQKFTSGSLMTSAEAGAVEYDANFFYATNGTPTRGRVCTDANVVVDGGGNVVTSGGQIVLAA